MNGPPQPRPPAGQRLLGHLLRPVVGVVPLGGLALLVYLVADAVASGSVFAIVATVIMLVFGAPAFVLGLLAVTWKTRMSRVIGRLLRRQHVPPSSPPQADPRA